DVLEADGGTRTASITGAFVALVDALRTIKDADFGTHYPLRDSIAATSCGIVGGKALLDLDYSEDSSASVDMNVIMTGSGKFVELQGTGEEATFDDEQLASLLKLGRGGIKQLTAIQAEALGKHWPF
ncbi:MAG: ribonuclease PH, partial [Pirellulales bacterium]|nr:ribonuclease PH [Pirellulales bacterium]